MAFLAFLVEDQQDGLGIAHRALALQDKARPARVLVRQLRLAQLVEDKVPIDHVALFIQADLTQVDQVAVLRPARAGS